MKVLCKKKYWNLKFTITLKIFSKFIVALLADVSIFFYSLYEDTDWADF